MNTPDQAPILKSAAPSDHSEQASATDPTQRSPDEAKRKPRIILWLMIAIVFTVIAIPLPHVNMALDFIFGAITCIALAFVVESAVVLISALGASGITKDENVVNPRGRAIGSVLLGSISLVAWIIPLLGVPISGVGVILGSSSRFTAARRLALIGNAISLICLIAALVNAYFGAMKQARFGGDQAIIGLVTGRVIDFFLS